MLYIYTDIYELENVVNSRIRSFLQSHGYPNVIVSRDLQSDNPPNELVWCRVIGPSVPVTDGLSYESFQVSVSCKETTDKSDRQRSSELTALLRAYLESQEFVTLPITTVTVGGGYPTSGLDGYDYPAYTFSLSVYQTATNTNV